ncbi:Cysteinyl-tRNA cytoplasmic [Brachionus plicatilis]|uniref:Cysteinyl-tRNA cytoplasmic n=1 Tax=Brachionus plicatilis TaxID=10195 RepID=A0A3M7RIC6_BRAPC|nr:Cysteinyl-tRNA cytoplasmic [Brachionus plicatilis]
MNPTSIISNELDQSFNENIEIPEMNLDEATVDSGPNNEEEFNHFNNNLTTTTPFIKKNNPINKDFLLVDIPKAYASHKSCIVCKADNSYQKASPDRVPSQVLAVYFYWLKTGLSQKIIATISELNLNKIDFEIRNEKSDDLTDLIEEGDIFILDKGFRDVMDYLKNERHLQPKLPSCIPPSQKQLTTEEANNTRLVTKYLKDIEHDITFGKYQLGQCISYLSSMFREKDNVYVYLNKDDKAIQGWVCECKVGLRTLGCCSHITAVIYYLSYGKYQSKIDDPGSTLLRLLGINVSEDDSEDEDYTEYIESFEDV